MNEIVAGVDASEESRAALAWAVEEARLRSATVIAVHAWEMPVVPTASGLIPPSAEVFTDVTGVKEAAENVVRSIVEQVAGSSGVDVRPLAVEGRPANALIDTAERQRAQLIVVGSRGHGAVVGLLLGSVSEQVVRHAPCPVVVHRGGSEERD